MNGSGHLTAGVAVCVCLLAGAAGPAHGLEPPTGWDGSLPFRCTLQPAGFEAVGPDPTADPYCVEFDKRRQNVTELGVVEFLSKEPARVAAALDKCWYFQSDHWRGSVVQEDGSTKTYEWDGHYFFDKATGDGGAWVTNFSLGGRTYDPSQIPGIPAEYARHLGPGTGGVRTRNSVPSDSRCVERAQREPAAIYAAQPLPDGSAPARCAAPTGAFGPGRLGPVALGDDEARVRAALGAPVTVKRGFLRYCLAGGGKFLVGQAGDRTGARGAGEERAVLLLTTHRHYALRGIARGSSRRALRRAFPLARRLFRQGRTDVMRLGRGMLAGVHSERVRYLAVTSTARVRRTGELRELLRRSQ